MTSFSEHLRFRSLSLFSQIYLHSQNDISLVSDLGFAVAPGVHALVSVEYSTVSIVLLKSQMLSCFITLVITTAQPSYMPDVIN